MLIYLATPYTAPTPDIMQARFDRAVELTGILMRAGLHVFSPIAHTHPVAMRAELPTGWEFWESFDYKMIRACDVLVVATEMDGWRESRGVTAEIGIAHELGRLVVYGALSLLPPEKS